MGKATAYLFATHRDLFGIRGIDRVNIFTANKEWKTPGMVIEESQWPHFEGPDPRRQWLPQWCLYLHIRGGTIASTEQ